MRELGLSVLMKKIDDQMPLIQADPLLKRSEHNDLPLVVYNASKQLFSPKEEHQLYAKGIVLDKEGTLVSIPLIKIYNLFEIPWFEVPEHDEVRVYEKLDGTMIHCFWYAGHWVLNTRSQFHNEFVDAAYDLLRPYTHTLDKSKSYVFELIHPNFPHVVNYSGQRSLTLISVWDGYGYLADIHMEEWPDVAEYHTAPSIDEAEVHGDEGSVICFVKDGYIVHRVKIKNEEYIKKFRLWHNLSLNTVKNLMWELQEFEDFEIFKVGINLPEELEEDYKTYFDQCAEDYRSALSNIQRIRSVGASLMQRCSTRKEYVMEIGTEHTFFSDFMKVYDNKPLDLERHFKQAPGSA